MDVITITLAIKIYFEKDPFGRRVTMDELKALSKEDRRHLAELCAKELGKKLAD